MKPSEIQQAISERSVPNFSNLKPDIRVKMIRDFFASKKSDGGAVLDVGCADGAIMAPLSLHLDVYGVDIAPELIAKARQNGVLAKRVDLETELLPFRDGVFQYALSTETIEHVVDTDWFLHEINRVMIPNGTLLLTFPNIRTWLGIVMMLLGLPPMFSARYRSGHFRDFTLRVMESALKNHGFKILGLSGCGFYIPGIGMKLAWISKLFPSWSSVIMIEAVKERESVYSKDDVTGDTAWRKGAF